MGYQKIRVPLPRPGKPHGPRGKEHADDTPERLRDAFDAYCYICSHPNADHLEPCTAEAYGRLKSESK